MTRIPLLKTEDGTQHDWIDNQDGTFTVKSQFDCEPLLDLNKAMATENDGYSPSRELRRVASIPMALIHKWLVEEGWNALDSRYSDKLKQKLNDPDYAFLRTAPGRI